MKLVTQYYVCQWNEKLINNLHVVSITYSVLTVRFKLRSNTTEDTTQAFLATPKNFFQALA